VLSVIIEIGRGFAALWVFTFHLNGPIGDAMPFLRIFARAGHFGVPVFFVISGYCMMAVAQRTLAKAESARMFLAWRFLRIFPPYWFSILALITIPFVLEGLSAMRTGNFVWPVLAWQSFSLAEWARYVTLTQAFTTEGKGLETAFSSLNVVYWTLAIEFQFYLVMFVALCMRRHFDRLLLATTLASLPVALLPEAYNTGWFLPYWPMFALGLGLHRALASGHGPARVLGDHGWMVSAAVVSVVVMLDLAFICSPLGQRFHVAYAHLSNLSQSLAVAIAFWAAVPLDRRLRSALDARATASLLLRPLVVLGTISYSLYLLHGKLHQIPLMFVRQVIPATSAWSPLLTILGTVLLAWGFSVLFEKPFLRRNLARRNDVPVVATPAVH